MIYDKRIINLRVTENVKAKINLVINYRIDQSILPVSWEQCWRNEIGIAARKSLVLLESRNACAFDHECGGIKAHAGSGTRMGPSACPTPRNAPAVIAFLLTPLRSIHDWWQCPIDHRRLRGEVCAVQRQERRRKYVHVSNPHGVVHHAPDYMRENS